MSKLIITFLVTISTLANGAQPVDLDEHLDQALKNGSAKHLLSNSWPGLAAANQALQRAGLKPAGQWQVSSTKNGGVGQTGCSFLTTSFSISTPTPKKPKSNLGIRDACTSLPKVELNYAPHDPLSSFFLGSFGPS